MTRSQYDFQFTDRDARILAVVARYRFLKTSQIRRLVFAENASVQPTRRRLRYLCSGKFLRAIQPPISGNGKPETVYILDKAGAAYVHHAGFDFPKYGRFKETSLPFLNHALGVSEFRLYLELALQNHPQARLHRFVSDFELKTGQQGLRGQHRFRLFQTLDDPTTGENYTFYPDAVVILSGKGQHESIKRLYFVEIDKGTENLTVIKRKLHAYKLAAQSTLVTKFGAGQRFRLLLQVPSQKRLQHIQDNFSDHDLAQDIWLAVDKQVSSDSIVTDTIWYDLKGNPHAILKKVE